MDLEEFGILYKSSPSKIEFIANFPMFERYFQTYSTFCYSFCTNTLRDIEMYPKCVLLESIGYPCEAGSDLQTSM
jgi:hypothetical protein